VDVAVQLRTEKNGAIVLHLFVAQRIEIRHRTIQSFSKVPLFNLYLRRQLREMSTKLSNNVLVSPGDEREFRGLVLGDHFMSTS
jgi:hypothetical protein